MGLQGKVALVTGSATGIGEAIARKLSAEGADVVIHGLEHEIEAAEAIVAELTGAGGKAVFISAQLANPEECAELVEEAVSWGGRLDILVNNAATMARSNLETTSPAVFDQIISINLRAPLLLIQAAKPHFSAAGGGRVLNIGSINGYCGEANLLAYAVSKGGLMTLTRNLGDALGPEGIKVNQLNLGWVLTPNEHALKMREGLPPDWPEHLPKVFAPGGRLLSPAEIAHFALAFLSDGGALISGSVVDLEQYPMVGRNPVKG